MPFTGTFSEELKRPAKKAGWVRSIPRCIGALLLLAALLKAQGAGLAPISAMGLFSAAWFQVSLIVAEVFLGLWLMARRLGMG